MSTGSAPIRSCDNRFIVSLDSVGFEPCVGDALGWQRMSVIAGILAAEPLLFLGLSVRASGLLDFPLWKPAAHHQVCPRAEPDAARWRSMTARIMALAECS